MPVLPKRRTVNLPSTAVAVTKLEEVFVLREPELIRRFLRKHAFLVGLLKQARVKLQRYFGAAAPLVLRLAQYPEENASELLLLIQTSLSASEALPLLDRFDEEWWLETLPKAQCKLTIKLEYI